MTTLPITATPTRTLTACTLCAAELPHTRHDTALPVAQRSTITATPAHSHRDTAADLPGYGQSLTGYPAI